MKEGKKLLLCQNLLEDDNIVETDLDTNNEGYSEIALTTLTAELARLGFVMVILCKSNHW